MDQAQTINDELIKGLNPSMTRLLQRGSSTSRFTENGWSNDEVPVVIEANGKEDDDSHGKASLLILLSGVLKKSLSSQKSPPKASDDDMPEYVFSLRSCLGGSHTDKSFFTQLPEVSALSFHTSHSSSSLGLTTPVQSKSVLSSPLAKIIMLSFISIFVLVAVLGSTSTGYSPSSASRIIYSSYRKLQEDFSSLDLLSGGIFGLGALHPSELTICPKDMEHHVPCYNVSLAMKAGLSNGEEYDRHCDLDDRSLCLIRPPRNYSLPLRWPHSKSGVWIGNTKVNHDLKGPKWERIKLGEDNLLTFDTQDVDGVQSHFHKIASVLGIPDDSSFNKIGVQTMLDIGCDYGSFAAHLLSRNVMTLCVAPYERQNSHVQVALDRGLPAMVGSLLTRQLPYPASSFNMIHCADCGVDWSQKDGLLLLEVNRLLKGDGYFVWTMSSMTSRGKFYEHVSSERFNEVTKSMCWASFPSEGPVFIWRKTADTICSTRLNKNLSACDADKSTDLTLYERLRHCLHEARTGPVLLEHELASTISGFSSEELSYDTSAWLLTVKNYWSIITPLLFSDHPKRPAEDDPLPPSNILRNVMDMNALHGGFNAALLEAGKSVWVMNVVPTSGPNTLPFIYQRGFIGTLHDWCEPFPTYPRTYDLLHGVGLLSQQLKFTAKCSLSNLLLEMDRILRPEGWVLLRDSADLIEEARLAASQMRWEARTIEVEGDNDLRLLVCQKVFWKS